MKIRINKNTLADMPDAVRAIVQTWKAQYGKAFVSVENREGFFPNEDARVTLLDLRSGATASAQAAGAFAGYTKLSPGAEVPLPVGVVAIEQGFFCGVPFLAIYQGAPKAIAA